MSRMVLLMFKRVPVSFMTLTHNRKPMKLEEKPKPLFLQFNSRTKDKDSDHGKYHFYR